MSGEEDNGQSILPPVYASFDIEANGTNPLQHSMLSLGIALYTDTRLLDVFYVKISPQVGSVEDVNTMQNFWAKHPDQWKEVTTDASTPEKSMTMLSNWLKQYNQIFSIKWIARPANCDWMWLKCYYERYGPPDRPNIGYYCHDLSSLLRAYSLCYKIRDKKTWMNQLAQNLPYTHNALEDAIYQGTMYMNLRKLFDRNKM